MAACGKLQPLPDAASGSAEHGRARRGADVLQILSGILPVGQLLLEVGIDKAAHHIHPVAVHNPVVLDHGAQI